MRPLRQRALVSADSKPSLPQHVRMHFDKTRNAFALLSPEKVLWPDEISLAILKRCDGRATAGDIAGDLARDYQGDEAEVRADVFAFLQDWSDRMVVRL